MRKLFFIFFDILLRVLNIRPFFKFLRKHKVLAIIPLAVLIFLFIKWFQSFRIEEFIEYKNSILNLAQDKPLNLSFYFFLIYVFISVLSLPGTSLFSVIGGFLFGFAKGTVLSVFAISIGSSFAFLLTRFFFRNFFIKKGGKKIKKIYEHLNKDEIYYLISFRLFPLTPIFFTNMLMGLGSIKFNVFYIVSFISFLPTTIIYANMGSQLSHLKGLEGLMDPNFLFAFSLVSLFPLFVNYFLKLIKKIRKTKKLQLESDKALLG